MKVAKKNISKLFVVNVVDIVAGVAVAVAAVVFVVAVVFGVAVVFVVVTVIITTFNCISESGKTRWNTFTSSTI